MNPALFVLLIILLSLQIGCMGSAHYFEAPSGATQYGSGTVPVNPDRFRVKAAAYPVFISMKDFAPPAPLDCSYGKCTALPLVEILKTDKWTVSHVFKNLYIITSESFSNRQCNFLAKTKVWGFGGMFGLCTGVLDFGVYITPEGVVSGGWAVLPGSRKLFSERQTYLNPHPKFNAGWPSGVVFRSNR